MDMYILYTDRQIYNIHRGAHWKCMLVRVCCVKMCNTHILVSSLSTIITIILGYDKFILLYFDTYHSTVFDSFIHIFSHQFLNNQNNMTLFFIPQM